MRIHTDLSQLRIVNEFVARAIPDVTFRKLEKHGSRTHMHAFEILLEGHGARHSRWANDGNYGNAGWRAATRDDWGIFLSILYDLDPEMRVGGTAAHPVYADIGDFHTKTNNRYNPESLDYLSAEWYSRGRHYEGN